jgi:hypothetical protein
MSEMIDNPYPACPGGVWLRGNLHTHTTRSDGMLSPQQAVDAYAGRGYDFLALSDHDIVTDGSGLDRRGMVLLPAREVSAAFGHLLLVGPGCDIAFRAHAGQQEMIDQVRAVGGITVLCHPNWGRNFNHYAIEKMRMLTGCSGVEIFNGSVVDEAGNAAALDKWAMLLEDQRPLFGFAHDDMHRPECVGRAWIMAQATERSPEAILAALRSGRFYASTGVTLDRIELEDAVVRVEAADAEALAVVVEAERRLVWIEGTELTFDTSICPGAYFRIEAYGRADRRAWSQPFFMGGERAERIATLLREKPALTVPVVARAPELTGDLSDSVWLQAAATDRLIRADNGAMPQVRTELRCLVADQTLFMGITCMEPLPERMRLLVRENGRSSIWADDGIEIFIDPDGTGNRYCHLMVNAAGFVTAKRGGDRSTEGETPQPRVRTTRAKAAYRVEMAISLADLGVSSLPPRMGFNLVRNRYAEPGRFVWSYVGESNHEPRRFGTLTFAVNPG